MAERTEITQPGVVLRSAGRHGAISPRLADSVLVALAAGVGGLTRAEVWRRLAETRWTS